MAKFEMDKASKISAKNRGVRVEWVKDLFQTKQIEELVVDAQADGLVLRTVTKLVPGGNMALFIFTR